jgi:hypothetical protein
MHTPLSHHVLSLGRRRRRRRRGGGGGGEKFNQRS